MVSLITPPRRRSRKRGGSSARSRLKRGVLNVHPEPEASAEPDAPRQLPVHLLGQPVRDARDRVGIRVDPNDRGDEPDAAIARDGRDRDRPHHLATLQPQGERVSRPVLVVALRFGFERAAHRDGRIPRPREHRDAEVEGIAHRIGRETLRAQSGEELGVAGAEAGTAKAGTQDVHDVGLRAGPPDAHRALAAHPGTVAPQAGCLHRDPFADHRRVGVDGQA